MNQAKLHFWQLSFIFLVVAVLALFQVWSNNQAESSDMMTQMMGQSMGDMMRMMHASNITLSDLLTWKQEMAQTMNMNMHDQGGYLRWLHDFTTSIIFFLTPFILAGTLLLLIVWHLS
ncbi:hypothetical protein [Sporomusa acidovorans]|uniref:hypothetical protein n=1 Tax=Sporomusa acidovorans TaxID=112900 RepID=UPI000886B9B9|nr:hypothetical protein [Sporomusa acidovorans]OZC18986.1 hypothetical protein SPACI_30720 [Sporomusa acidovorans DSM 3132]SDD72167.1 hypothetical protein SAMN04488499_1003160 [Sporomusa acidovorans]